MFLLVFGVDQILQALKDNKNPVFGLTELINFAYRINETYKEFAQLEN